MNNTDIKNAISSGALLSTNKDLTSAEQKTVGRVSHNLSVLIKVFGMQYKHGVLTMPNNRLFGFDQEGG